MLEELINMVLSSDITFGHPITYFDAKQIAFAVMDRDVYAVRDLIVKITGDNSEWMRNKAYYLAEEMKRHYYSN